MTKINNRLESLQPFVLSIRFNKGLTVVDTLFKDGWSVPKSDEIGFEVMPEKPNYYMLYPLSDDIGIDEILNHVEYVIKLNVEREMKYNLLLSKIKELEEIFKHSSLVKCETLKFNFDEVKTNINENLSLKDIPLDVTPRQKVEQRQPKKEIEPKIEIKDGEPPLAEVVEREVDADVEAWNRRAQDDFPTARVGNEIIDLPPRNNKVEVETFEAPEAVCHCDPNDPNQVCPVCIDQKM